MKYYIGEYWEMANSLDPEIRKMGIQKWEETAKKYDWNAVKDKLPKGFLKEFNKNNWFHDYLFESVSINNLGKNKCSIELYISYYVKDSQYSDYLIILKDICSTSIKVPNIDNWAFGKMAWGYTEFELLDTGLWCMRILCDFDSELEFVFKKISIKKLKSDN